MQLRHNVCSKDGVCTARSDHVHASFVRVQRGSSREFQRGLSVCGKFRFFVARLEGVHQCRSDGSEVGICAARS